MPSRSSSRAILRQPSSEWVGKLIKSNSTSRSSSPSNPNRRIAKLNSYLSRSASARNSSDQLNRASEAVPIPPSRRSLIKRWDGNRRTTVKWDSIRRDPELWLPHGDCLVHFYERGYSRRGASLRVSLADIESTNCRPLLEHFYAAAAEDGALTATPNSEESSPTREDFGDPSPPAQHELYIPAPTHLSREEAFRYHLVTRNFFAWMYDQPLVGARLGDALISLLERMYQYRRNSEENQDNILAYIDGQGYTDFRECPDHALAVLQFAERFGYGELWTDAFVHCTGMNDRLDSSTEFEYISRSSQALITRAYMEMDLRSERAGRSLANFLEDDLSGAYLGLGKEAQLHLERFRSFLHTYYVGQHGYWPPAPVEGHSDALPTSIYRTMYFDFRNLYDYLVDSSSGVSMQDNKPVDGGICVFQNVVAFDKRNKFTPLPSPLPLVPRVPAPLSHKKSFGGLKLFGSRHAKFDRRAAAFSALSSSTNTHDDQVVSSGLVREYSRFERMWTMGEEETVSCADARKVRWILIYAILQTLISVTRCPTEVRDTEGVSYPLCCQTAGTPPWQTGRQDIRKKIDLQPIRMSSLKERILEMGPDLDVLSVTPVPLVVKSQSTKTPSAARRLSFTTRKLSLRSPKPVRTTSWEILTREFSGISPVDTDTASSPTTYSPASPILQNIIPIEPLNTSPPAPQSDLSTPSTSEAGGSSGWSPSSSEDDMDHASVHGSADSNYGDDEDEEQQQERPRSAFKPSTRPSSAKGSLRLVEGNPEVDLYLRS